jgi:hypothetical protein
MRVLPLLLLFITLLNCSRAQVSSPTMTDTTSAIAPNMIRIIGKVISADPEKATLKVTKVLGSGQGVINMPSEGQQISVSLTDKSKKPKGGETITAELTEKMGADASQSFYVILQYKRSH